MRVYHFVSRDHGLENLKLRRLKVAEINGLNDPFELRSISSPDPAIRRAFENTRASVAAKRGMLCFSSKWSNPVLWSHYADRHQGLVLGFDVSADWLVEVRYRRKRTQFDLLAIQRGGDEAERQVLALLTTKFSHWRYESEWRSFLALNRCDSEAGLHFVRFSKDIVLREVIVGSDSSIARDEIAAALGALKDDVSVLKARLAFRSFKVVRQMKSSLWT